MNNSSGAPACNGAHLPPDPDQHMPASHCQSKSSVAGPSVPQTTTNSSSSGLKGPNSDQGQTGGRNEDQKGVTCVPGFSVKREGEGDPEKEPKEEDVKLHDGCGVHISGALKPDPDDLMPDVVGVKEEEDEIVGEEVLAGKGKEMKKVVEDPQELLQEFYAEVRQVDRGQEVERIVSAFKLNPFEQLSLRMDATLDEVRRQYRKLSLMVHPDKCQHERAREAFEALGEAQAFLLEDEKRTQLIFGLETAREEVRNERKKATKHDSAVRVASILHEEGRAGVEAEYELTEEFNYLWKMKAREILAKTEWRKRKLAKRLKEEEERIEVEEKEEREMAKRKKEHHDTWEKTRETRVGTWRNYLNNKKGGKKNKKTKAHGELRPPKMKTNDEEKLYVQRPLGEQFRPQPKKK